MKLLDETATATSLREGAEGVRSILAAAARGRNTPLKELAKQVHMPLPVVSAVRRELEKRGVTTFLIATKTFEPLVLAQAKARKIEARLLVVDHPIGPYATGPY